MFIPQKNTLMFPLLTSVHTLPTRPGAGKQLQNTAGTVTMIHFPYKTEQSKKKEGSIISLCLRLKRAVQASACAVYREFSGFSVR